MKTINFGIIGCGLMGREFASAAARWCHLSDDIPAPKIVAVSDINKNNSEWFVKNVPTVKAAFDDYSELLKMEEIDAVYVAVPHVLHQEIYTAVLRAGKHLMGEKPFGMNKAQNDAITEEIHRHPELCVRCSSEFPYFPAMQQLINMIKSGKLGRIIEIKCGFNHSSDLDPNKPINWKRQVATNGEYGCMGDLGIHTQHVPFRLGFYPKNVFAKLSKFISTRPDGKGGTAACDTWDNATLICDTQDASGNIFPMYIETKRLDPGSTDNWYFEIYGLEGSAKFSTQSPNTLTFSTAMGSEQSWSHVNVGYKPMIKTITGGIFEFGFTDAILQMWASFLSEIDGRDVPFGTFTPDEAVLSHRLLSAALLSNKEGKVVEV